MTRPFNVILIAENPKGKGMPTERDPPDTDRKNIYLGILTNNKNAGKIYTKTINMIDIE